VACVCHLADSEAHEPLVVAVLGTFVDKASIVVVVPVGQVVPRVDDLVVVALVLGDADFGLVPRPFHGFSFVVEQLPRLLLLVVLLENQNREAHQLEERAVALKVVRALTHAVVGVDYSELAKLLVMLHTDVGVAASERSTVGGFSEPVDAAVRRIHWHGDSTEDDLGPLVPCQDLPAPCHTLQCLDVGA